MLQQPLEHVEMAWVGSLRDPLFDQAERLGLIEDVAHLVLPGGLRRETSIAVAPRPRSPVRSPIDSSKDAVNLGANDEPGLNGASSCVPAGGLR